MKDQIEEFLLERGVLRVGFPPWETLAGGPPLARTGPTSCQRPVRPASPCPWIRDKVRLYLSKRDHAAHEQDNIDMNRRSSRGWPRKRSSGWRNKGYPSKRVVANLNYRQEEEGWELPLRTETPIVTATWRCVRGWGRSAGPATSG